MIKSLIAAVLLEHEGQALGVLTAATYPDPVWPSRVRSGQQLEGVGVCRADHG